MSLQNDREAFEREFERLRNSGRVARDPGGAGFDVESLPDFFNSVAHLWDTKFAADCAPLHRETARRIARADEPVRILDVGCGTGLELEAIFERAPNARVTAMDQAPRMLGELACKYASRLHQIELLEASCVDWPEHLRDFDYVVSVLCVHHFPPDTKVGIYRSFRQALKPGGMYIEGDQMTRGEAGGEDHELFERWIARLPGGRLGEWNYDVTLNAETNRALLLEAGFTAVDGPWIVPADKPTYVPDHGVLAARKSIFRDATAGTP